MGPVGLESSVRIPQTKNTTFKIQKEQYGYNKDTMRDLYHRKDRLIYWIKRINSDLEEPDRIGCSSISRTYARKRKSDSVDN